MGKSSKLKWKRKENRKQKNLDKVGSDDDYLDMILGYEMLKSMKGIVDDFSIYRAISDQLVGNDERFEWVIETLIKYVMVNEDGNEEKSKFEILDSFEKSADTDKFEIISMAFERNLNLHTADHTETLINWPYGKWIHLGKYSSGYYASIRLYRDESSNPGGDYELFYETDEAKEVREQKMREYAEYFLNDYGVGTIDSLTCLFIRLYLHEIQYKCIEEDYEKIIKFIEKEPENGNE